jgi:hypothetical protein
MSKRSESALARWRGIIEQHEASGLPVARFCKERGVPESSFFAWRRRLRAAGPLPAFIEVRAKAPHADGDATRGVDAARGTAESSSPPIELLLPGDRRLLVRGGFDRQLLADLVRTIEALEPQAAPAPGASA